MKTTNIPAGSSRHSNVGLVWREVLKDGTGDSTFRVPMQGTVRVSASGGDVEVTVDGVVAMTLRSGEVEYINVGTGLGGDDRSTIEVVISSGAANARVQVAKEKETGRRDR